MPRRRAGARPGVETLDQRLAMSVSHPTAAVVHAPAAVSPARSFTPEDLQAYADAYLATRGNPRFNAAYDFNGDGRIGRNDVGPILRGLAASTPRIPFRLQLTLAPGERVRGHHPSVNGAATRLAEVTVVGRTTPNSIIFTDRFRARPGETLINFQFQGTPVVSDSRGVFTLPVTLVELAEAGSLTTTAFQVRTPFGQSTIRAFPILRIR